MRDNQASLREVVVEVPRQSPIPISLRAVLGYGLLDGWPPPNLQDNEDRWYSTSPYRGLTQNNLHLLQNQAATGQGGTCFGDSGGPHFWGDTLTIVSVTSWGDAICRSNDMTQRIDLGSVLEWLAEFGVTPA